MWSAIVRSLSLDGYGRNDVRLENDNIQEHVMSGGAIVFKSHCSLIHLFESHNFGQGCVLKNEPLLIIVTMT